MREQTNRVCSGNLTFVSDYQMLNMRLLLPLFLFLSIVGRTQTDSLSLTVPFSTDSTRITAWNGERYVPIFLKGINLGVAVPGTYPGELAATNQDYQRWFEGIREAGFNAIRLYTLHFPAFYDELASYNEQHPESPLYFIQGVWLE